MNPEEVAHSYNQIAEHWDSAAFPRENGVAQHERAIAFTDQRGPALDIGCGSSGRLIDLLQEHGFAAEGLDISSRMVELARRRHPALKFHQANIVEWPFPREYAFITAWDSIWHVPLRGQEAVLRKIVAGLAAGGVAIFTIGGTDEPSEITNAHMGPPMYYATLGIPRTLQVIAEAGAVCRHLEYDQHPQPHVSIVCQRRRPAGP